MSHNTPVVQVFPEGIYRDTPIRDTIARYLPDNRDAVEDARDAIDHYDTASEASLDAEKSALEAAVDTSEADVKATIEDEHEAVTEKLAVVDNMLSGIESWLDGSLDNTPVPPLPTSPLARGNKRHLTGHPWYGLRVAWGYEHDVNGVSSLPGPISEMDVGLSPGVFLTRDSWANYEAPSGYSVGSITVDEQGSGYNPNNPPNVVVEGVGGVGEGALATVVVGEDEWVELADGTTALLKAGGYIDSIHVAEPGHSFMQASGVTVTIDPPPPAAEGAEPNVQATASASLVTGGDLPQSAYTSPGLAVFSIWPGVVVKRGSGNGNLGRTMTIKHDNGYWSRYSMLRVLGPPEGTRVNQGQQIGWMGPLNVGEEEYRYMLFEVAHTDVMETEAWAYWGQKSNSWKDDNLIDPATLFPG